MRFLARLATGEVALWRVFWLIGVPLSLAWDLTGLGMVIGVGIGDPIIAGSIIVLFGLCCIAIPFVSFAIWRSASNYPRKTWWHTPLAWLAKACAVFTGLATGASLIAGSYLLYDFIDAAISG